MSPDGKHHEHATESRSRVDHDDGSSVTTRVCSCGAIRRHYVDHEEALDGTLVFVTRATRWFFLESAYCS